MASFWFNWVFMDDLSCLLVVCKKYVNANGKDSKYTNAIDISITGPSGGGGGSAGGRGSCSVGGARSFIASISATFFCIISNIFPCSFHCFCGLPQHVLGLLFAFLQCFADVYFKGIQFLSILFLIQSGRMCHGAT